MAQRTRRRKAVEVLRGDDREIEWAGRAQFLFDAENASSLEDVLSCANQLAEAKFDAWEPRLRMTCPCCVDRSIADDVSLAEMLAALRGYVAGYAELQGLADNLGLALLLLWEEFILGVDSAASGKGYCSVTGCCERSSRARHDKHDKASRGCWTKAHTACRCSKERGRRSKPVRTEACAISRLQFAEGLSQVLCLNMSWLALRALTDAFADASSKVEYGRFCALLQPPCAQPSPCAARDVALMSKHICHLVRTEAMDAGGLLRHFDPLNQGAVSRARWLREFGPRSKSNANSKGPMVDKAASSALFTKYSGAARATRASSEAFLQLILGLVLHRIRALEAKYERANPHAFEERAFRSAIGDLEAFTKSVFVLAQAQ